MEAKEAKGRDIEQEYKAKPEGLVDACLVSWYCRYHGRDFNTAYSSPTNRTGPFSPPFPIIGFLPKKQKKSKFSHKSADGKLHGLQISVR